MEDSSKRVDALTAIRSRVAQNVGSWLKDEECVQLALACTTRAVDEVVEFMFASNVAKIAKTVGHSSLGITKSEWSQLFGPLAQPTRGGQLAEVVRDSKFLAASSELGDALRRTVEEPSQRQIWERAWSKMILFAGMHMNNDEELLEMALGNLISSDTRRLEELRSKIDDRGPETMLLCTVLATLAETVT